MYTGNNGKLIITRYQSINQSINQYKPLT